MGLLDRIVDWQAKNHGKGTMKAMLFSALQFKEKYADEEVMSGFLAAEALYCRPKWERMSEFDFVYRPNGMSLSIQADNSLAEVTTKVVMIEIQEMAAALPVERQAEVMIAANTGISNALGSTERRRAA